MPSDVSEERLRFFERIADGCEEQAEKQAIQDPDYGKCYPLDSVNLSQAATAIRELLQSRRSDAGVRDAAIEECAKVINSKADLYKAYAERAERAHDIEKATLMWMHNATTLDDARSIRALKR